MKSRGVVKSRSFPPNVGRLVLAIVFMATLFVISRGVFRLLSSGERVQDAQERLKEVKLKQEELKTRLQEVNRDFYQEKQARDKLGLAKPGEIVVVLPDEDLLKRLSPRALEQENLEPPEPNWRKWARLFF
jgi:cell division protein FtsB